MAEPTPSTLSMLAGFAGGVGLFLLGIHMMTDGLKLAAGRALEDLLERYTSTPARGLATGVLITALVHSSTAVTVAGIGFVNTGLLSLHNALWVVFGANVGTTLNSWLVATLGFGLRIDSFALPFTGLGAALLLRGRTMRSRAFGQAVAGFGLLFLGIAVLKEHFSGFGAGLDLVGLSRPGLSGMLLLIATGALMTLLMQASAAVIAIVITAAEGGLLPVEAACALVIGTNIGTSKTAILAAIGATSNARRLAVAHVVFNLLTGLVALLLLPTMIAMLARLPQWFTAAPPTPAVLIAMFHTAFNLLGVLLMTPCSGLLLRRLESCFRSREDVVSRPRHLDANSLAVPDLALRALRLELDRSQQLARASVEAALAVAESTPPADMLALQTLAVAISHYAHQLSSNRLPPALVETLARCLRALQYQESAAEAAHQAGQLGSPLAARIELAPALKAFRVAAAAVTRGADPSASDFRNEQLDASLQRAEQVYQQLKATLLLAGADARLDIAHMQDGLRQASLLRRATEQLAKAARMLTTLQTGGTLAAEPRSAP